MSMFNNEDLKVLNVTHIDFDGGAANIVVQNFYKTVYTEVTNYGKEQALYDTIKKYLPKIDAIVITDFTPVNIKAIQQLGKPVLVLDHHESAQQFNDPQNHVYVNLKYCGAMLAYKYFSAYKDLSHIQDIIAIANDYDLFTLNDKRSMCFNAMFWEMGFKWFVRRFKNGNTNLYPEEMEYLRWYKQDVQQYYDELPIVELPHKGAMFNTLKYSGEMSMLLRKDYDYLVIPHDNSISLRSATDNINLLNVCQTIGKGGGHRKACGVPIDGEDVQKLVQRICFAVEHELNYGKELPF